MNKHLILITSTQKYIWIHTKKKGAELEKALDKTYGPYSWTMLPYHLWAFVTV